MTALLAETQIFLSVSQSITFKTINTYFMSVQFNVTPNVHVLTVKYLGATNTQGSRVKIISERFKENVLIPFGSEFSRTLDVAEDYLLKKGFKLIGMGEGLNGYYIITDTFESPKVLNAIPFEQKKHGVKMESLTIIGRRWFDKVNGNTYFSSQALVNGKPAVEIDYEYGYGDQYIFSTFMKLVDKNLITDNHSTCIPSLYCSERGIAFVTSVSDVKRKKDL